MRTFFAGLFGTAIVVGTVVCSPMTASALPIATGAASSFEVANPFVEKVVVRRRAPARRFVRGRSGGISPGAAALIGLGVAGVAAVIVNDQQQRERARQQRLQQYYYQQQYGNPYGQQPAYARQPVCGWQQQPTYDQYGNYRGDRAVQVCQ